jgi:hypothetical protein
MTVAHQNLLAVVSPKKVIDPGTFAESTIEHAWLVDVFQRDRWYHRSTQQFSQKRIELVGQLFFFLCVIESITFLKEAEVVAPSWVKDDSCFLSTSQAPPYLVHRHAMNAVDHAKG